MGKSKNKELKKFARFDNVLTRLHNYEETQERNLNARVCFCDESILKDNSTIHYISTIEN